MALNINPNAPTPEEIAEHERKVTAHNMKVAKANMSSKMAEALCSQPGVMDHGAKGVANFAIAIAETIIETYSLMPDAAGNKGGLVS